MNYDKAYVISLEQNLKRRKHFFKVAQRAQLEVEWFPAIYGLDVDIQHHQKRGYLADDFKLKLAGSLGTLLSHVQVWEKVAADENCEVGLVFEDDAIFNKQFKKHLDEIDLNLVPDDWDMLWLGWHKLDCLPINEHWGKPKLSSTKKSVNSGHFAYLVKSSSVEKMKGILLPYNNQNSKDVILRNNFDQFNAYFLTKKIATTPLIGFDSIRKNINNPNRLNNHPGKRIIQRFRRRLLG